MQKIELMAPAGNFESLQAALDNGADSVYFGVEQLNMRARASINFTLDDLEEIFLEKSFPKTVEKFLYDPHQWYSPSSELRIVKHWGEIYEYFFKT